MARKGLPKWTVCATATRVLMTPPSTDVFVSRVFYIFFEVSVFPVANRLFLYVRSRLARDFSV